MKAIIFDMDGTIVLSEKLHHKAFQSVFKELKVKFPYDFFVKNYAGTGSKYIISNMFRRNKILKEPYPFILKKKQVFQDLLKKTKLKTVPGLDKFFEKIREDKKIKVALASGTNMDNISATLKNIGYEDKFKVAVSAEHVGNPKPAPDVFLLAAKKLRIDPKDCVVFEDSTAGVKAAKAAGMKVIALTTTVSAYILKKAGADKVVKNYKEVKMENLF